MELSFLLAVIVTRNLYLKLSQTSTQVMKRTLLGQIYKFPSVMLRGTYTIICAAP